MKISKSIDENRELISDKFNSSENFDFIIRDFYININDKNIKCFLAFFDGLVKQELINRDIMKGLISESYKSENESLSDFVFKRLLSAAPVSEEDDVDTIVEQITFGHCIVFVDGAEKCYAADVKGFGSRGVEKPIREASLSGPQEAFNEMMLNNVSLIRKILKEPKLVAEKISVGTRSKTPCSILYIEGITNKRLVGEIRNRLTKIDTDYIFSSGDIEMFVESKSYFPLARTLKTEIPDRAAALIADGKVAIVVHGSPFVLILPTTSSDLIEAAEDNYVRVTEANFMKIIRVVGILLSIFFPAVFIAVTLYHKEVFPTELLLAIEATREKVPFSLVTELFLMEIAFELIKEASVRVPNPIGSTLGIIGGLILGQAAVDADIVSPISIIVVSVAGLGAFASPSVEFSRSLTVFRFIYMIVASVSGLVGFICLLLVNICYLASSEVYGVPFLSPIAAFDRYEKGILISPIWKREKRPRNLKTQDDKKQPHISRKWLKG